MNERDKELAKQAGLAKRYVSKTRCESGIVIKDIDALQKFSELIRADEREACAKVCEPQEQHDDPLTAWKIAASIRERKNT